MSDRKIVFLGSSAAYPSEGYFHSSFIFHSGGGYKLLTDTMGGYDIIRAFRKNDIDLFSINAIFITHPALDHAFGLAWIIRQISSAVRDNNVNYET